MPRSRNASSASRRSAQRRDPVVTSDPVRVVYVAGLGRSGSTLLGALLGQLDDFFYAGELHRAGRVLGSGSLCGCGRPLEACEIWRAVADASGAELGPLELPASEEHVRGVLRQLLRTRGLLPRSPAVECNRSAVAALLGAIRDVTGAAVVVDSSKRPGYGLFLDQTDGVELFIVHLVRDPHAVAHSRLRTGTRRGDRLRPGPAGFAFTWSLWNPTIEAVWRRGRYLLLRYEDLVADPAGSVARVAALVGRPAQRLSIGPGGSVELLPTHSIAGNRSRFETGVVPIRLDDEWRTASRLNRRQRLALRALTYPVRQRYGYG